MGIHIFKYSDTKHIALGKIMVEGNDSNETDFEQNNLTQSPW